MYTYVMFHIKVFVTDIYFVIREEKEKSKKKSKKFQKSKLLNKIQILDFRF